MKRFTKRFLTQLVVCLSVMYYPTANAAESIDAAVTAIAKRFVESRSGQTEPIRVAVTAFVQSDRKTTQFTNLLMIALTGKLVQYGSHVFQVIERAQLQTAINEITSTDNIVFDKNTAKELGNFLGVDALLVGEITTLTDIVRLDARLIDVETISTLKESYEWVPLTPTVQNQLSKTAIAVGMQSRNDDAGTDPRNGIWRGTGTCGEISFGVAVSIVVRAGNKLSAMQTYFPLSNIGGDKFESGSLSMEGTVDAANGKFTLTPTDWLYRPSNDVALGFTGFIDTESRKITATYDQEGCGDVLLRQDR